jgi:hypothetical protein
VACDPDQVGVALRKIPERVDISMESAAVDDSRVVAVVRVGGMEEGPDVHSGRGAREEGMAVGLKNADKNEGMVVERLVEGHI